MPQADAWLKFVIAALATWRLTHLVAYEDGPWDVIARIRRRAADGFWGKLMDCYYCSSLWVAAAVTLLLGSSLRDWFLTWVGLSGAACLLERLGQAHVEIKPMEPLVRDTQGETDHVVLRSESREGAEFDNQAGRDPIE